MQAITRQRIFWSVWPFAVGMLLPSAVVFCVQTLVGHVGPGAALMDVLQQQFGEGENLFLLALIGCIPFGALSMICMMASSRLSGARLSCVGWGGLLGILVLMIPAHASVWYPAYSGEHMSSTAVVAFFFIPFYCLVPMVIGLLAGWGVSCLPAVRQRR